MATGHVLPGYVDPVSRLNRVNCVGYPIENEKLLKMREETSLHRNEFEAIRAKAREIWSKPDIEKTTYNFHYCGDRLGSLVPTRPSSAQRKNKPHPPMVFLTNRLHHIPGYGKPDATIHNRAYRVDGSEGLDIVENQARHLTRSKYIGRPSTSSMRPYKDPYHLKEFLEPTVAQATEAWLKQASKEEKEDAMYVLENQRQNYLESQRYEESPRAQTAIPSTYRWMKQAGPQELVRLHGFSSIKDVPTNPPLPSTLQTLGLRRSVTQTTRKPNLYFKSARGDYSIHPDWPPSLPHHNIPLPRHELTIHHI